LKVVGRRKKLYKKEAILVVQDVLAECDGSLLERCVSLVPIAAPKTLEDYGRFEVHISCMVDDDLRRCLGVVVSKHKLAMRQTGNVIILFHPKA
jgi:hypothetical protein